jgi:hypothetical protein
MDSSRRGQAPYGFRWQGGELRVVAEEAGVRRAAAEFLLKRGSCAAAARELNAAGHRTRRGGEWSDVQVARILSCPSAIGRYEAGSQGGKDGPPSGGEAMECEPLLAPGTWDRVQAVLKKRAKGKKGRPDDGPGPILAGLVWCACGQRLRADGETGKFRCAECRAAIPFPDLEAIFAEDLFEVVSGIPALSASLGAPSKARQAREDLAFALSRHEAAKAKREGAERMLAEGSIRKERFREIHEPLESEIRLIESDIARLRGKTEGGQSLPDVGPGDWKRQWSAWPASRRRQIALAFAERITLREGEVEIAYLLPESSPKDADPIRQTSHPTNQAKIAGQPTYIRLPKPGGKCAVTGLSRAKLNELILPNARNNFAPPVASKSLRQKGAQRGIRLVLLESLLAHLSGKP